MPTYEFACPTGHQFTRFYRKMSDAVSELPCPECGQVAARKISGGAGLLFKGSGFYITDYGKDGKKAAAPAKAGEGAGGDSTSGGDSSRDTGAAAADRGTPSTPAAAPQPTSATNSAAAPAQRPSGPPAKKKGPAAE